MRRPRLLIDSDGVLSAFTAAALEVVAEQTGKRFALADVTRFDFCDALGLAKSDRRRVMETIRTRRGFVAGMQTLPGAVAAMGALRELAEVYVVTKPWPRSPTWTSERVEWLWQHFGIDEDHVLPIGAKHLIDGELFVDDSSDHVRAWLADRPAGIGVLWGTPHNTGEAVPAGAHLLSSRSWPTLVGMVRGLAEPQREIAGRC